MKWYTVSSLVILNVIALLFVRFLVIPYAQIPWDEAVFLLRALSLHELFSSGNINGIVANIFDRWQFAYPPLQELYLAFFPFQFSITIARSMNMLGLCVTSFFLYQLSKLYSHKTSFAHTISANIFLFTSPLILFFSGIAMKETMSTAFTVATIYFYIQSIQQHSLRKFFFTGILLGSTFLVKYQLIYTIVATILLNQGILFFTSNKKHLIALSTSVLLAPFLTIAAIWILYPVNHIPQFIEQMSNTFNYTGGLTSPINYALFHLRGILNMYSPSLPLGCLYLFSLFWTLKYIKKSVVRVPLLFVWVNSIISTIHYINIQERYILPAMPFVFFLSGITLIDISRDAWNYLHRKKCIFIWYGVAIILSGIVIFDLYKLPLRVYQAGSVSIKGPIFTQSDYKDSWFSIDRTGWPEKFPWEAHETPLDVIHFVADSIDVSKPYWLYGENGYFPGKLFQLVFAMRKTSHRALSLPHDKYAIVVRLLPDSFYYTKDVQRVSGYQQTLAIQYIYNPIGTLLTSKLFRELGVEVLIYQEFF